MLEVLQDVRSDLVKLLKLDFPHERDVVITPVLARLIVFGNRFSLELLDVLDHVLGHLTVVRRLFKALVLVLAPQSDEGGEVALVSWVRQRLTRQVLLRQGLNARFSRINHILLRDVGALVHCALLNGKAFAFLLESLLLFKASLLF